jgi:multidrug efflux pump subunit AcrB
MDNQDEPRTIAGFFRWAIKPPQAYVMYLIALVLVGGLSFYAGSLKPKKAPGVVPPTAAVPRSQ